MHTISGTTRRPADAAGEIDLAETALTEQPLDAVAQTGFGALDDLGGSQQERRRDPRRPPPA